MPGCIPVYQEVAACHAANYRYFHDWKELSAEQQAFLIAHYISQHLLETNQQDAEARAMKAQGKH